MAPSDTSTPPGHRRRASIPTAFFSLPTTSEFFRKTQFKPTKIFGVLYLAEAKPDADRLRLHTVEKLLEFPRFSSRVKLETNFFGTRQAFFERIPREQIDVDYHFQVIQGQQTFSAEDNISEMVSEAHLLDWDPDKPLWKITLVTDMKDGRSMILAIVDHTVGDGTSLAAIMSSIFDKNDNHSETKEPSSKAKAADTPLRLSHRILMNLYSVYFGTVGFPLVPADPETCLKVSAKNKRAAPIGRKCSATRHFPLEEIKAIKSQFQGATLNDVLNALVTMAFRRYLEKAPGRPIHMMFAINYRPPSTTMEDLVRQGGSNRVVGGCLAVPLSYTSPLDAVWRCKAAMDIYRRTPLIPIFSHISNVAMGFLPQMLLEHIALDNYFKSTGCLSNVMGPTKQAKLGGYVVDDIAFYGMATAQGTYIGVLSYNNQLRMFICMDKHVDADPDGLRDALEAAYQELKDATKAASPSELIPPDSTPMSAKVLEWALPILLIVALGRWLAVAT
ncbi:Putative diacyglycerol O-acyltransferase [Seminavis robusta]|uniref:Diacyglycerol O-acyltransferase n=1 Tax=Seminavis robusta TaxID=568900 RepID=A0A9N8E7P4_9STRA|nr:Putative diacyglycerol O-acyltransferase [Seminavis robusta]|eukprot:Sro584_g170880.1 Putative diacyglycerol O-acyltransferase (503) ;mRNA; r:51847-53355